MEYDVCALDDIADGGKKVAKLGGTRVLLLRAGDEVFAVRNTCPHMKVPLSIGTAAVLPDMLKAIGQIKLSF